MKKISHDEAKAYCDKVIEEWKEVGGIINSYGWGDLFIEDEEAYFDWIKEEGLEDTTENQKEYCSCALHNCRMYSDSEIEKLLEWD